MWILLAKDNETVIELYSPDTDYELVCKDAETFDGIIVPITLENSPAYLNGKYKYGKFYEPKEDE